MGTRSTTQVRVNGEPLLTFYRQHDGYLSGHGKDMLPMLKRTHVNGYNDASTQYNGPGNFAAMLVASLFEGRFCAKPGVMNCGSIYIVDHSKFGDQEFNYGIDFNDSTQPPTVSVDYYGKAHKDLSVAQFEALIEAPEEED